ncbi:MAG: stalk domain-containing protein [Gudongella sp.]|nr:stalk domain-containing protein [Gudongella sp.]
MKTKKTKKLALLVAAVMLLMVFSTTGFAAYFTQTLQASYRNITVFVNGAQKNFTHEPFIVDGTTYVPLRDMSEVLGNTVSFNPTTYRIDITDTGDAGMQYEIYIKDARIAELEKKLAEKEDSSSDMDLDDLEDELNDDYDEIGKVDIEKIKLDGDEDDIEVEIYIDTTDDDVFADWNDLDDDDIEDFLQDIVDDILDVFKDADITGFIEDEFDDDKVEEFYINSSDDVKLGSSSSSDIEDINDLEDELEDEFDKYEGLKFSFDVDDDSNGDIEVNIKVTDGELADLTDTEIKNYLKDVCEFIEDEYDDYDDYIYGTLDDDDTGDEEIDFDYDGALDWDFID